MSRASMRDIRDKVESAVSESFKDLAGEAETFPIEEIKKERELCLSVLFAACLDYDGEEIGKEFNLDQKAIAHNYEEGLSVMQGSNDMGGLAFFNVARELEINISQFKL